MAQLTIVYWRDIPAQVIAKHGRKSAKIQLSERFEKAIDSAAMRAKLTGTDAYLEAWRRAEPVACGEDLDAEVKAAAARIEQDYDRARLLELINAGGQEPTKASI
ncbi:MAG: virulence factor [Geminicoccaceae bacterium]